MLDGFGHVSIRHPQERDTLFHVALDRAGAGHRRRRVEHDFDNNPVHEPRTATKKLYYERWIHGEVYKARPDVNAVVHSHSPTVVPFASTKAPLKPLLHNASFLGFGAPVFDIRNIVKHSDLMISSAPLGQAMVAAMGSACVVLLRGHGNVVVGPTHADRRVPRLLLRDQCTPAD